MALTEKQARAIVDAAIAEATRMNRKITAAVVDAGGYLIALVRMDGASFLSPSIAEAKAFTAAAWRIPGEVIAQRAKGKPETYQGFIGVGRTQIIPGHGSRPIEIGGEIVGAVAVSGASGEEDEAIALKGLEAVKA